MRYIVEPSALTSGTLIVPGDKSISHRALMLGGIAEGRSRVRGFLPGEDCRATLAALRAMGVRIDEPEPATLVIDGAGLEGLRQPGGGTLDLGNSGTAMRLFAGLLAGQSFTTTLTGDASLSRRPMKRVITPLSMMGAEIGSHHGRPPLTVHGNCELAGINYRLPVASAQVKSAILLAGLYARGDVYLTEPDVTRDHTERMLMTMGVTLSADHGHVRMPGGQQPKAADMDVPADLSSAAFPMVAALIAPHCELRLVDVGVNPTRTGIIEILRAMGAEIAVENPRLMGNEPVADLRVRSSRLRGMEVDPALVSRSIDEFPILFIAAAAATGRTRFSGLAELRVKESDRIHAMATGLRALGITVDETDDGAEIFGGTFAGGTVDSQGDHRVAMSFAVAGSVASDAVHVRDVAAVDTSFPGFAQGMASLGMVIEQREEAA